MSVNWQIRRAQLVIDLLVSVSLFAAVNGAVYWLMTSEEGFLGALDNIFVESAFVVLIGFSYLVIGAMAFSSRVTSIGKHEVVIRRFFGKKETYSLKNVEYQFSVVRALYAFRCSGDRRFVWNHLGGATRLATSVGE